MELNQHFVFAGSCGNVSFAGYAGDNGGTGLASSVVAATGAVQVPTAASPPIITVAASPPPPPPAPLSSPPPLNTSPPPSPSPQVTYSADDIVQILVGSLLPTNRLAKGVVWQSIVELR